MLWSDIIRFREIDTSKGLKLATKKALMIDFKRM
jgi:hypothetical protein